jgi:hypothetical protein
MTSDSDLTELTELTPTTPSDEPPELRALTEAANDAAFELVYNRLPKAASCKVNGISYVKYDAIRGARSKRSAWYWHKCQSEELLRATKGASHQHY